MSTIELQENPSIPVNRLNQSHSSGRNSRLKTAAIIIGAVALLTFILQISGTLGQQNTDIAAMGDKIHQLEDDNKGLKNSMEAQAKAAKSTKADLALTQTKLETTRQDLDTTQADLIDTQKKLAETQSAFMAIKNQLQSSHDEMAAWRKDYTTEMTAFLKKDQEYRGDIRTILQKIQSLDVGSLNDKIYELQMTVMNLEKKLIGPKQTPFEDNTEKSHLIAPAQS
jgi:chromosome segregation ATPase